MAAMQVWKFLHSIWPDGGKENFSIPESESETDEEIITAFIRDFYGGNPTAIPKEIILPLLPSDCELISSWMTKLKGTEVSIQVPQRGFKRRLKDMAMANAAKYLSDKSCSGNTRMPGNREL